MPAPGLVPKASRERLGGDVAGGCLELEAVVWSPFGLYRLSISSPRREGKKERKMWKTLGPGPSGVGAPRLGDVDPCASLKPRKPRPACRSEAGTGRCACSERPLPSVVSSPLSLCCCQGSTGGFRPIAQAQLPQGRGAWKKPCRWGPAPCFHTLQLSQPLGRCETSPIGETISDSQAQTRDVFCLWNRR